MKYIRNIITMILIAAVVLTGIWNNTATGAAAQKTIIRLNKTTVRLKEGAKTTLKVKTENVQKIKSAKWSIKNKKIAKSYSV